MSTQEEMPIYQPFTERRNSPDEAAATLFLIRQVYDKIHEMDSKLTTHITDETLILAEEIAKLMNSAFPAADPDGHRLYHEAQMRAAEDRADFWKKMRFEIAKYGLLGFLGWAAGVIALSLWEKYVGR